MDLKAEQQKLESDQRAIEQYLDHPISRKIFADSVDEQERLIKLLCGVSINNIESFFAHFEAIGHLRGLRRAKALVEDSLEEVKEKLKELQ